MKGEILLAKECPRCDGTGRDAYLVGGGPFTDSKTCDNCDGTGEVEE